MADYAGKEIVGGFTSAALKLYAPPDAASYVDHFCVQGVRLRFVGEGGGGRCWNLGQVGFFGVLAAQIGCVVACDPCMTIDDSFVSPLVWGSGNEAAVIHLDGGAIVYTASVLTSGQFPIATTSPTFILAGLDAACPAWNTAASPPAFTTVRNLTLVNVLALVSGGGFCPDSVGLPRFFNPNYSCGVTRLSA
jgi:hypothetical protein